MTVKEARKRFKISQGQLAKMCQMTQVQICRIENGLASPHHTTIYKIEKALGMHLNWTLNNNSLITRKPFKLRRTRGKPEAIL